MWDSNSLLQLLKSMPNELSKEDLEKIQMLIDADKYKCSLLSGFNLCDMNMYAPFCKNCTKSSIYPCAVSYVHMMKAGGMNIQIGASPVAEPKQTERAEEIYKETAVSSMPENSEVYAEEKAEAAVEEEIFYNEPVEEVPANEEPAAEAIPSEETIEEEYVEEQQIVEEITSEEIIEDAHAEETPVNEEQTVVEEQPVAQDEAISEQNEDAVKNVSEIVKTTEKRKIRIAVARKRL